MSDLKFCPACGAVLVPNDRFCGDCGFDTESLAPSPSPRVEKLPAQADPLPAALHQQTALKPAAYQSAGGQPMPARGPSQPLGVKTGGSKNALLIIVFLLAVLLMGGGGAYWWLSRGEDLGKMATVPSANQNQVTTVPAAQPATTTKAAAVDLSRASTYLSEPGLKCTFSVNYPDGMAGVVERISARVVANEAVRVSEVETGVEQGEAFGYGFHYVERSDGTYYILDQTPNEIIPVLKNNLAVGKTWNYQNNAGKITWTVLEMGVNLNLGFATFEDCLLVKEDNQAVGFQSITYYSPGRGSVLVKNPGKTVDYYKLIGLTSIDSAQAAAIVKKWSPNYYNIGDYQTQN